MAEWQSIETAPAASAGPQRRILVIGGHIHEPELVLPDGDWWRLRKAQGGSVPEWWMDVPAWPVKAAQIEGKEE